MKTAFRKQLKMEKLVIFLSPKNEVVF